MTCNNCKTPMWDTEIVERCWYCYGPLCGPCWEKSGHCGHPEADEANRKTRERREKKCG